MIDKELAEKIQKGDRKAFAELTEKYSLRVFHTAMGFVHCKEDAEDLTQEIFIKVYRSIAGFRKEADFSTWLYRITINTCINYVNNKNKLSIIDFTGNIFTLFEDSHKLQSKHPEQILTEKERDEQIRNAIDGLPDKQRIAFVLSKYDELPQKEIASIMQISEGAVEQHLQRARMNLQKKLQHLVGN